MLKLSISLPLFLRKADADRPRPGAPSINGSPRRPERRLSLVEAIGHPAARVRATASLLDHLIRAQYYRWGYGKAERFGGFAVHDHLELARQLHREIARPRAAQNAIAAGSRS
jgi:hypothetical protein